MRQIPYRTVLLVGISGIALTALLWAVLRSDRPEANVGGGVWTCSMHPQIRMDHFDRCPLCGMDLTPVNAVANAGGDDTAPDHLSLSEHARRMAQVETVELQPRELFKELRTVGKVEYDETALTYITARIAGRVDEVFASFPGTVVKRGDHLVSIYSPDLLATQSEFLDAFRREARTPRTENTGSQLADSARRRLELWGVTEQQIEELIGDGRPQDHLVIHAPFGGTIVDKNVRPGQYVETGATLFRLADLSRVWLILEVFESDVAWVQFGQTVEVTLEGLPEKVMHGKVAFIEPVLNEATRTVRVRVVLPNKDDLLKPGMYAQALLRIPIRADGTPGSTGLEGKFACPMHPYIVEDQAADCDVCGMPLERVPGEPDATVDSEALAVPADAVLTTGKRQLVFVERDAGSYQLIAPHLGTRTGDYYPVLAGLAAGDRVVRRGNFLLDSQFQISGKPSLLYPLGMSAVGAHQHGGGPSQAQAPSGQDGQVAANLARMAEDDRPRAIEQATCPITDEPLGSMGVPVRVDLEGTPVYLCCAGCRSQAEENATTTLQKVRQPKDVSPPPAHQHETIGNELTP